MSIELEMQKMQERLNQLELTNRRLEQTNRNLEQTIREKKPLNSMFKEVSLNLSEVTNINKEHSLYQMGAYVFPADNMVPRLDNRGYFKNSPELHAYELHDIFRKAALSVYGTKKNSEIQTLSEQEDVARIYDHFKQVWLEEYNQRLDNLEAKNG